MIRTYALKLVMLVVKVSPVRGTAVLVSRVWAMLTFPQGFAAVGCWTSFLTPVPLTPKAGAMRACACTCIVKPRTRAMVTKTLENMMACEM